MKCPHCNIAFHLNIKKAILVQDLDYPLPTGEIAPAGHWEEMFQRCPECGKTVIWLQRTSLAEEGRIPRFMAYPKGLYKAHFPRRYRALQA
jgi:hypothetical protein